MKQGVIVLVLLVGIAILNGCAMKEQSISKDESNYAWAWYKKGVELMKLDKYESALECFDKAIKLNPNHAEVWCAKGYALINLGKNKETKIDNFEFTSYNLSRFEEALKAFEKAIKINPDFAEAWFYKGMALSGLGKYEEEIECYDKAIQLNPKDYKAWYNKGTALQRLGRYGEALEAFEKAIKINPDVRKFMSANVRLNKMKQKRRRGNYE